MVARGIKTHVFMNIIILLIMSMGMIDIIFYSVSNREFIRRELTHSITKLQYIAAHLKEKKKEKFLNDLSNDNSVQCIGYIPQDSKEYYFSENCNHKEILKTLLTSSMIQKGSIYKLWDEGKYTEKGVVHHQYAAVIDTLELSNNMAAVVGTVFDITDISQIHWRMQKKIIFYMFIGIMILVPIATYRINSSYFRPIKRLANRAFEYKDEKEIVFNVRKEDDALESLSLALNQMMERIKTDKKKLRETIKELEYVNRQLMDAQQYIIRAEKLASIGRLSSGIAHEIGNPIGIILGYLDLLKNLKLSEEKRVDYIKRSEDEVKRIDSIIKQLSDLSHSKNDQKKITHLHDILTGVLSVLSQQPSFSSIKFKTEFLCKDDQIASDSGLLRQVFLNLLINAADSIAVSMNASKGSIVILTEEINRKVLRIKDSVRGPFIKIKIADNGSGIPESIINNIFDPFFTTKEPGKGTGLGLYVSLIIVEKLGGTILAKNNEKTGASISIILPIQREDLV